LRARNDTKLPLIGDRSASVAMPTPRSTCLAHDATCNFDNDERATRLQPMPWRLATRTPASKLRPADRRLVCCSSHLSRSQHVCGLYVSIRAYKSSRSPANSSRASCYSSNPVGSSF